jgi:outer membrane protein assembly factor BamB
MRAAKRLAVVLTVLLTAACALVESPEDGAGSESGTASPDATTSAAPSDDVDAGPAVDPAAFPRAFAADDKTVLPEKPVYDGLVVGARLVTMTLDQLRARTLPELDSAWQISPTGLFVDVETNDEQLYALDLRVEEGVGTSAGRLSMTLSRISPATGTVLGEVTWDKTQDVQASGDPVVRIVEVVGDVVVVESRGSGEESRRTVTAVDVSSGDELWTRRPATFVAMDEARVVMSTATATDEGALVAVDVETGAREWSGLPGLTAVNGVGVHDGELTVVAETAARATPAIMTVSLEDGSLQSEEPTKVVDWGCRPAVDTVVVCSLPGERAVGYDLERGRTTWQLPTSGRYGVWVSSVRGPYVYGFTSGGRSVVLDAETGRDVTETAGAAPVSSNGYGGLIFYSGQAIFYPTAPDATSDTQ